MLGVILFFLGDDAAARTHLEQGISLTDPTAEWDLALRHGAAPGMRCLVVAADTLWCLGYPAQAVRRYVEGLCLLGVALAVMADNGRGDLLAEASQLPGELLLQLAIPDAAQAEARFHQALVIARQQRAKSWELHPAMSLSRLWQQQGMCKEAHNLLAPIYGWFTDRFDTADLQEAKASLQALSR